MDNVHLAVHIDDFLNYFLHGLLNYFLHVLLNRHLQACSVRICTFVPVKQANGGCAGTQFACTMVAWPPLISLSLEGYGMVKHPPHPRSIHPQANYPPATITRKQLLDPPASKLSTSKSGSTRKQTIHQQANCVPARPPSRTLVALPSHIPQADVASSSERRRL